MGFASTDPDQSSVRKDKFKSRIGGVIEEPTLNVGSSSKPSQSMGNSGSLNSKESTNLENYLTTRYGRDPYGPGGYFNNPTEPESQYAKRQAEDAKKRREYKQQNQIKNDPVYRQQDAVAKQL